jgi:hypothetical protein
MQIQWGAKIGADNTHEAMDRGLGEATSYPSHVFLIVAIGLHMQFEVEAELLPFKGAGIAVWHRSSESMLLYL